MISNLCKLTMFQWKMLQLTTVTVLVLSFQGFSPGRILVTQFVTSCGGFNWDIRGSSLDLLADYKPPEDTGKPKDSSGAGGRSWRSEDVSLESLS
jgi:hypothetical protein